MHYALRTYCILVSVSELLDRLHYSGQYSYTRVVFRVYDIVSYNIRCNTNKKEINEKNCEKTKMENKRQILIYIQDLGI